MNPWATVDILLARYSVRSERGSEERVRAGQDRVEGDRLWNGQGTSAFWPPDGARMRGGDARRPDALMHTVVGYGEEQEPAARPVITIPPEQPTPKLSTNKRIQTLVELYVNVETPKVSPPGALEKSNPLVSRGFAASRPGSSPMFNMSPTTDDHYSGGSPKVRQHRPPALECLQTRKQQV